MAKFMIIKKCFVLQVFITVMQKLCGFYISSAFYLHDNLVKYLYENVSFLTDFKQG